MVVYNDWGLPRSVSSHHVAYVQSFNGPSTIALLLMGHAYMVILVFICQTLVYREVTTLFSLKRKGDHEEREAKDPWSKTLNWYFFAVANYFLYGESIIYYFKVCHSVANRLLSQINSVYSMLFSRMLNSLDLRQTIDSLASRCTSSVLLGSCCR